MDNYLKDFGFKTNNNVYYNLEAPQLVEQAIRRKEACLSKSGALVFDTGERTGRSANDKYFVYYDELEDRIAWSKTNQKFAQEDYNKVKKDVLEYLDTKELFVFDGYAVADKKYQSSVRVVSEYATQSLFIQNMLMRPDDFTVSIDERPDIHIIAAPDFHLDTDIHHTRSHVGIFLDVVQKEVIICGTKYNGEIKKSVFTLLNYLLPQDDILPMHCSANIGLDNTTAVFFGLSGTGKTTLSTDPHRAMIGDDEHGWSKEGIFNMEGGIYAKCANLKKESEPEIYNSIRFGAVLENVILDEHSRVPDYFNLTKTENSRVCFPLHFLDNIEVPSVGPHPNNIIFLTADAFGVLPPVSKLTKEQAMYHFIAGYTSKLAGTEEGITTPTATFSACFGEPFLPLPAKEYAKMLGKKMDEFNSDVYLVNTGWIKGSYGVGERISLKVTRSIIDAILSGELATQQFTNDNIFGLHIPLTCPNVVSSVLNPKLSWEDKQAYDETATMLAKLFQKNMESFDLDEEIQSAGPII